MTLADPNWGMVFHKLILFFTTNKEEYEQKARYNQTFSYRFEEKNMNHHEMQPFLGQSQIWYIGLLQHWDFPINLSQA